MSKVQDLIALGRERRAANPYREDAKRWDAASLVNTITGSGGSSDKGAVSRPNGSVIPLSWREVEALWENNGIARRIAETVPKYATRKGWDIEGLAQETEQELGLQGQIREGMTWGNVYGGSVGLLVTEDDVPMGEDGDRWLRQPLDMERIGRFHCIQIMDPYEARPLEWDKNPRSRNYRMPRLWSINTEGIYADVHHSRVLHFRGATRPPSWRRWGHRTYHNFPDASVFQALWDDIRRYIDVLQGGATVAQEMRQHVLKLGALAGVLDSKGRNDLKRFMDTFIQSLSTHGMAVIGPNDEYHQAQQAPSGFMELTDTMREALSAVTGFPQAILFGDSPSGLNTDGESAWQGFRQLIDDAQQDKVKPKLERVAQVAFAAQDRHPETEPPEGRIRVKFMPLSEPSDMEEAALREAISNSDQTNISMGVYTAAAVARHRFGPDGYNSEAIRLTEEELADVEFEAEQRQAMSLMPGGGLMMGAPDGSGAPPLPAAPGAQPVEAGGGAPPGAPPQPAGPNPGGGEPRPRGPAGR